jgi:hypothetical protein
VRLPTQYEYASNEIPQPPVQSSAQDKNDASSSNRHIDVRNTPPFAGVLASLLLTCRVDFDAVNFHKRFRLWKPLL